jgi:hypothetical protein
MQHHELTTSKPERASTSPRASVLTRSFDPVSVCPCRTGSSLATTRKYPTTAWPILISHVGKDARTAGVEVMVLTPIILNGDTNRAYTGTLSGA